MAQTKVSFSTPSLLQFVGNKVPYCLVELTFVEFSWQFHESEQQLTYGQSVLLQISHANLCLSQITAIHRHASFWNAVELFSPTSSRETSSNFVPFVPETPFYFDSDRSATRGWYVNNHCWQRKLSELPCCFLIISFMYLHVFRKHTNLFSRKLFIRALKKRAIITQSNMRNGKLTRR
jgi:hypothetical protein